MKYFSAHVKYKHTVSPWKSLNLWSICRSVFMQSNFLRTFLHFYPCLVKYDLFFKGENCDACLYLPLVKCSCELQWSNCYASEAKHQQNVSLN